MKNLITTVCVLSLFLLITLACSDSGTKNYDSKPITSTTSQNFSDMAPTEYAANTTPIIEPTVEKAQLSVKAAVVISEDASLRKSPGLSGEVLASLPEDADIDVIKQKGAWFFVRTKDGQEGWLHGNAIRYLNDAQSNDFTVSRDLESEPETSTVYVQPQYVLPQPAETVAVETRQAETLETPAAPIYRSTPVPSYSQRDETPTVTTEESRSTRSTPTALCADGTYSYSANRQGTCSWHGGVAQWLDSSLSSSSPTYSTPRRSSSSDDNYRPKTVNVRGYTRRDGTYVAPHTRSAPRRRN